MKQLPLPIGAAAIPGFDEFVPGSNEEALQHLRGLVAALQRPARPRRFSMTYLWGPAGAGKTHLLSAVASAMQGFGARVRCLGPATPGPWPPAEDSPLVLIDDCDGLDEERQQAAFATLVEAQSEGLAVLAAGRLPPVDLPLREDLRTRLGWGQVFALKPLTEAQSRAALRREADRRGIFLADDLMDFLLSRFPRDLSSLMRWLDRIDEYSLSHKRQVSLALVRRMLSEAVDGA